VRSSGAAHATSNQGRYFVSDSRRLVYVSGAPGSGKTSLAVPLAAELGYALVAKDRIKPELAHDSGFWAGAAL
jgi:Ni2+-binding GTPase involved in maturation of urease and hydrogenase